MIGGGEDTTMIAGKWMNKNTGDIINVKNSIISGNDMIVITDAGEIDMVSFSKNFVQVSDKLYNNSGKELSSDEAKKVKEQQQEEEKFEFNQDFPEELLKKIEEDIEEETYSTIKPSTSVVEQKEKHVVKTNKQSKSISRQKLEKEDLIRPIFEKIGINPKITFSIDCDNFPVAQFKMMKEFFDVTETDIANYIIHYIISDEDFVKSIEDFVKSKMT